MIDQLGILEEALSRSIANGNLSANKPLNIPQREALINYHQFVSQPPAHARVDRRRAYFDMATGTGKTGLFSIILRHAHLTAQDYGLGEQFKSVIVVPTTILLKQTCDDLIEFAPDMRAKIGIYGGRSKDLSRPITIMTYDAWVDLLAQGHLQNISLEVMDESHHGLSSLRQKIRRENFSQAVHLGVTASAQYDNQKTMEITHHNLIYKIGLRDAIQQGFLTDYAHVQYGLMRILPSLTERQQQRFLRGEIPALKQQEWSKLVVRNYATMIDEISGQPLSDKIAAIFAANTTHADNLAAMLNANPLLKRKAEAKGFKDVAISVHTIGQSEAEQERRLDAFKAGEYMAITGDKKIQAGFNHPPVKFTACYPGDSLVEIVQEIGRATRKWMDPETGTLQGTVILESIPYLGDANPEKDKKAQTKALANTVTAYQILKGTTVYAPTRVPSVAKIEDRPRKSIVISPNCTVEIFASEQDSLLVSRLIDDARKNVRIEVTPSMRDELNERVAVRGGYRGRRLVNEIEKYEAEKNLESTGLLDYEIQEILSGKVRSIELTQWTRLNEVLDGLPLVDIKARINVTSRMLEKLKDKIAARGGYSYIRLANEVKKYEETRQLVTAGITQPTIARIIQGTVRTIEAAQWQRLNDVVDAMPEQEMGQRTEITPAMIADFNAKIEERGRYGAVRLMREVERFETEKELPSAGLTHTKVAELIMGYPKSIPTPQWQRINAVLDSIPSLRPSELTAITPDMIADVKSRIAVRGNFGARRFIQNVRQYEAEKKLYGVRLNVEDVADILAERTTSMQTVKWQRLNEVLDALPEIGGRVQIIPIKPSVSDEPKTPEIANFPPAPRERIEMASPSLTELKRKIFSRGNFGAHRLITEVTNYERENHLEPTGLTGPIIVTILTEKIATVNSLQWKRLNEAVDSLPLLEAQERIEFTSEMHAALLAKVRDKGNPRARALETLISRYESEHSLDSIGIDASMLGGLFDQKYRTVGLIQWQRITAVLDEMPSVEARDRITITPKMRTTILAKIEAKGGFGATRITNEIEAFENKNEVPSAGITVGVISGALFDEEVKVKTMIADQWKRLNEALDALPDTSIPARVEITPEMLATLKTEIHERGGLGNKTLARAITDYEKEQRLASVELRDGLLNHLLAGRAKSLQGAQWARLNEVIATLPLQKPRKRIQITAEANAKFQTDVASHGSYGGRRLFAAVQEYEAQNRLSDTGLMVDVVERLVHGKLRSVDADQWKRLNDAIQSLPLQGAPVRVDISPEVLEALRGHIRERGGYGGVRLAQEVELYEKKHSLVSVGLDKDRVHRVLMGYYQTLEEKQLQRLKDTIEALPLAEVQQTIPVTPEMIADLDKRIRERGNLRAQRLLQISEQEDNSVKLTYSYINQFLVQNSIVRNTDEARWTRLNDIVNGLPVQTGDAPQVSTGKTLKQKSGAVTTATTLRETLANIGLNLPERMNELQARNPSGYKILEAFEQVFNETLGLRTKRSDRTLASEIQDLLPTVAAQAMVGFKDARTAVTRVIPELFEEQAVIHKSQRPKRNAGSPRTKAADGGTRPQ